MDWQDYLDTNQTRFEQELLEFVAIPSVSAKPDHMADVERAAQWVAARLEKAGIENTAVLPTSGHPAVYGDWLHAGPDKPTVLIYGHFDVQPAEPFDLWLSPPFQPEIREGRVWGRGASDDKGGMFIPILATEALLATTGRLPVNIKFLFEGQEEIGSPDMPPFIAAEARRLSCDMIFSADGLQWTADEAQLVMGLKGLVGVELIVEGAQADQHSGLHGGGINNPLMALSQILASMKDAQTGRITIDGFYDDVVELTVEDKEDIARVPFDEAEYCAELGVTEAFGEEGYTVRERLWARPTLELNGLTGGYQGAGSKTVLPARASAKITCRLVANQRPERIAELIAAHVAAYTPPGVTARIEHLAGDADPFLVPRGHNASQAAGEVLREVYGADPYVTRVGGSIPIMTLFLRALGVHGVMFGFSIADENLHAPNEFFRLENFRRGQTAYCRLLERLGQ
ncbi:dipeptidase [Ruegeria aquimaris]|uniref:Dipeptidase n=1 Tax=Ruegeria aquimaris TaxID=2984333 RepID=A0ABT3AEU3_9RHOB|nr:dipeptidase [Ruegeria sp. XHP0148]MCV2887193.1 dipeptidase [Ruegeria sp. XHP0148]